MSPLASADAFDGRTLEDPRLQRFLAASRPSPSEAVASSRWDLDALTLAALYYHPDLRVARARLAAAEADVVIARQRPNPTLNLGFEFNSAAIAGAFPPSALPLTVGPLVNFLIETAGRREYRTAQARHLAVAARADLDAARWQVRGRVRAALLLLWAARQRMALARQQIALRQQLVGLLDQRREAGFATGLDASLEHIALGHAVLAGSDADRQQADANVQLASAIGIPVSALDRVPLSGTAFDHPGIVDRGPALDLFRRQALTLRPDIQASLARYAASQSALQLAIAGQIPNVTLGPGYNYDVGIDRYGLSPTIDLPIFNQNQGQIARAAADRQQAAAEFIALQARAIGGTDGALAAVRSAARSLRAADMLLNDEQGRQRRIQASFAAGQTDRPALLAADLEAATVRSLRLDALLSQRQALGALEDALQQPLFDDDGTGYLHPRTELPR